ncbi:HalOD1 output domain-containing protein [Natrinema sp. 74]|uniref:HalOD1 output domain-containing protein n=1 Tax=Natrinema sp. 74 TaxID=3384159 RepID=UPI0038D46F89
MSEISDTPLADRVGYDPETETYHVQFAWTGPEPASYAVVQSLAAVTDTEPESMQPLYKTLEPNALDALFQPGSNDTPRPQGTVSFAHEGHDVTVHASGEIIIDVSEEERGVIPAQDECHTARSGYESLALSKQSSRSGTFR